MASVLVYAHTTARRLSLRSGGITTNSRAAGPLQTETRSSALLLGLSVD